jgi:hypothetical protein
VQLGRWRIHGSVLGLQALYLSDVPGLPLLSALGCSDDGASAGNIDSPCPDAPYATEIPLRPFQSDTNVVFTLENEDGVRTVRGEITIADGTVAMRDDLQFVSECIKSDGYKIELGINMNRATLEAGSYDGIDDDLSSIVAEYEVFQGASSRTDAWKGRFLQVTKRAGKRASQNWSSPTPLPTRIPSTTGSGNACTAASA